MLFKYSCYPIALLGICSLFTGCAGTRQLAVDPPQITTQSINPLSGLSSIDGDDYYFRLISEFEPKGDTILKSGCHETTPVYETGALSAAMVYRIRNDNLKFSREATGFYYQAGTGKCNFTFDAKKQYLTPWFRLDSGKDTAVDYHFYTDANSDVDVAELVGDVNAASGLLALTGVGMGVSLMGQFAGQWLNYAQPVQASPKAVASKHSSETHSLPSFVSYRGNQGQLNQAAFNIFEIVENGFSLFDAETRQIGDLNVFPELAPSLLLKVSVEGVPDARDLTWEEIKITPIRSADGDINLQQLIERASQPAKFNLKPDWNNYMEVENNCRQLKRLMKDLGFNRFDRNAVLYYFLQQSRDWLNYNTSARDLSVTSARFQTIKSYRDKGFSACLSGNDYSAMKMMGLPVNTLEDWDRIGTASEQYEQWFVPLKAMERQLLAVVKSRSVVEMERQLFPLLATAKGGVGTVLLQNHLGDLGFEELLADNVHEVNGVKQAEILAGETSVNHSKQSLSSGQEAVKAAIERTIPGEGVLINSSQLAQIFSKILGSELSCSRPPPDQLGKPLVKSGILLFTAKANDADIKGGAMEYEFVDGKISRIAFQLPTYRDFEQDIVNRPDVGGCRIEAAFLAKIH